MLQWEGLHSDSGKIVLKKLSWNCVVQHLHCKLSSVQEYKNTTFRNIEAVYTFALPRDAVVTSFSIKTGGKTLTARIAPRAQAGETYEKALNAGDMPCMLEYGDNGICTANIGNLKPRQQVLICITCEWMLQQSDGSVRVTVPMVAAERYSRSGTQGKLLPHQFLRESFFAQYPFEARFEFIGEQYRRSSFSTPGFSAQCQFGEHSVIVAIKSGFADRDLVVTACETSPFADSYLLFDGKHYRGIAVVPVPRPESSLGKQPLNLNLVIDCSGSMTGAAIDEARRALKALVPELNSKDKLALTLFGSAPQTVFQKPQPCTRQFLRRDYLPCIDAVDSSLGGTEMAAALKQAASLYTHDNDILLMTDGQIWETTECINIARQAHARVFVIGIGHAANAPFCYAIAQATCGAVEMVLPSEDMTAAVGRMIARMRAPTMSIESIHPAGSLTDEHIASQAFAGETMTLFFKFKKIPNAVPRMELRGTDNTSFMVEGARWRMIEDAGLLKVASNHELACGNVEDPEQFAQDYELLSAETSFILVDERSAEQKTTDPAELQQIPQMKAAFLHEPVAINCSRPRSLGSRIIDKLRPSADKMASYSICGLRPYRTVLPSSEDFKQRANQVLSGKSLPQELLALFVELETATGLDKAEIFLFYMRWLNRTAPTPLSQMFAQFNDVAEHFAEPQIIAKLEEKFSQYASKVP